MSGHQAFLLFLIFLLLGTLILSVAALFRLVRLAWSGSGRKHLPVMMATCMLAWALRIWGAPMEHRVYYDELRYASVSQNIFFKGISGITLKGSGMAPEVLWESDRFVGFALLLALLYALIGNANSQAPFVLNIILGILSVALVYFIAWRLFRDRVIAWWAAIFLALSPVHILCSTCANADTSGFFFFLLSVTFFLEWRVCRMGFLETGRADSGILFLLAAVFTLCYGVYIKPEYGIIGIAWLAFYYCMIPEVDGRGFKQFMISTGFFLVLLIPLGLQMPNIMAAESFFGPMYSWQHIERHFFGNVQYLLDLDKMNVLSGVAFLLGIAVVPFRREDRVSRWLVILFMVGFMAVSGYFAGGFLKNSMARHFLKLTLPFLLLAGVGMRCVIEKCHRFGVVISAVLFLMAGASTLHALGIGVDYAQLYRSSRPAVGHRGWPSNGWLAHRQDGKIFKMVERFVPDDAYIVYDRPEFFLTRTTRKVISWNLLVSQPQPARIVLVHGLSWGNEQALSRKATVNRLKNYACRELLAADLILHSDKTFKIDLCERQLGLRQ